MSSDLRYQALLLNPVHKRFIDLTQERAHVAVHLYQTWMREAVVLAEMGGRLPPGKDREAIRRWAQRNGLDVSSTGQLPAEVVAAHREMYPRYEGNIAIDPDGGYWDVPETMSGKYTRTPAARWMQLGEEYDECESVIEEHGSSITTLLRVRELEYLALDGDVIEMFRREVRALLTTRGVAL